MTSFDARLRLLGRSGFPLGVGVDLDGERMTPTTGRSEVASWLLEEISVLQMPDGFHISAEGEVVVLNVSDPSRFAIELGLQTR